VQAVEIERINEIGEGLVKLFVSLEAAIGAKHKDFIKSEAFKGINEGVKGDFAAKIAEAEAPGTSLLLCLSFFSIRPCSPFAVAVRLPGDGDLSLGELARVS
jgi:hypothetical protein